MISYFKAPTITSGAPKINTLKISSHFYITLYGNTIPTFGYTWSHILIHMELRFVLMDP